MPNITQEIIDKFDQLTHKTAQGARLNSDKEYAELQASWNRDIIRRSLNYLPKERNEIIGIGSFLGVLEMSFAGHYNRVNCVDFKNFLPSWRPKNTSFIKANIDSATWKLPEKMYDACFFIETIEHLLWSPMPLLMWMKTHAHFSIISTPDDKEWPEMNIHPWSRYQGYQNIPPASPGAKGNPIPMDHCKQYTQAEFINLLDDVGFRVLEFFRTGEGNHQMVAIVQPRSQ